MPEKKKKDFFTHNLMLWHRNHNRREMPWKGEKDPYKIWLSEIILQQTRVDQGLKYYNSFIENFPTVQMLALAADNDVFKLWEGLGYYSRCKNLLASARNIAIEQDGIFPNSYDEIIKLKGVGPYTAAAIASFAFDLPYAVTDGNVLRVLARYNSISTPIDTPEGKKYFTALAQTLLDKAAPALYNQAIMDFGATICKPQLPLCDVCVLQNNCGAFKKNMINNLPVKMGKLVKKHRYFYYIIAEYAGKFYVRQRIGKDIWQNLWEFILAEKSIKTDPKIFLKSEPFLSLISTQFTMKNISRYFKQQLTHQTIETVFIHILLDKPLKSANFSAINKKELSKLAFPRTIRHYMDEYLLQV